MKFYNVIPFLNVLLILISVILMYTTTINILMFPICYFIYVIITAYIIDIHKVMYTDLEIKWSVLLTVTTVMMLIFISIIVMLLQDSNIIHTSYDSIGVIMAIAGLCTIHSIHHIMSV